MRLALGRRRMYRRHMCNSSKRKRIELGLSCTSDTTDTCNSRSKGPCRTQKKTCESRNEEENRFENDRSNLNRPNRFARVSASCIRKRGTVVFCHRGSSWSSRSRSNFSGQKSFQSGKNVNNRTTFCVAHVRPCPKTDWMWPRVWRAKLKFWMPATIRLIRWQTRPPSCAVI